MAISGLEIFLIITLLCTSIMSLVASIIGCVMYYKDIPAKDQQKNKKLQPIFYTALGLSIFSILIAIFIIIYKYKSRHVYSEPTATPTRSPTKQKTTISEFRQSLSFNDQTNFDLLSNKAKQAILNQSSENRLEYFHKTNKQISDKLQKLANKKGISVRELETQIKDKADLSNIGKKNVDIKNTDTFKNNERKILFERFKKIPHDKQDEFKKSLTPEQQYYIRNLDTGGKSAKVKSASVKKASTKSASVKKASTKSASVRLGESHATKYMWQINF